MSKMKHEEGKPKVLRIKDCIGSDVQLEFIKESGMEDKHVGITFDDGDSRFYLLLNQQSCKRLSKFLRSIIK